MKIEQCLNDAVIERIREHVKEMSSMQTHCEIRPFYLDLLREWNIKEEIQNNHKEIKEAEEANDKSIEQLPPNKKRRIDPENKETQDSKMKKEEE